MNKNKHLSSGQLKTGTQAAPHSSDFLSRRRLQTGTAGWVLLAGLGVSYVISGDYSGWNYGLIEGGFYGLAIAAAIIAAMYVALALTMAELSTSLPTAGGGYTFARRALGPWGGYATGVATLLEYSLAPAAIATFIGSYVESLGLFGIADGWWIYLSVYVIFIGIHLIGVGEALKFMFAISLIALAGIVIFAVCAIPLFEVSNLTNIQSSEGAVGSSPLLPNGFLGIWAAAPFAIWFFIAIEGVPLAAEEARDPARNMPKGIFAALTVLALTATTVLVLATGAGGAEQIGQSGSPLVEALGTGNAAKLINYIGLAGLIASFFSVIYAYSRQLFALSRAGYLPTGLSVTNRRKAPMWALIVPGAIGFLMSLSGQGALLINMVVLFAALSYVLIAASHIVLRRKEPSMERPYRTPGGTITSGIALILAVFAVAATFVVDLRASLWCVGVYAVFLLYFALYSKHRLVSNSPDEELALIQDRSHDR